MKRKSSFILASILILMLSLSLFVEAKGVTVGISLLTREHVYYNTLENAAKDEAKKLGFDLIVCDANFDSAKQMAQVQDFIIQGVDAIILSPVSEAGGEPAIKLAQKANIPVFTMDTTTTGEIVAHVATDNYKADNWQANTWQRRS